MNYNTRNIIKTYAAITGNEDKSRIVRVLSKSPTFRAVRKVNSVLVYEGHSANLLEIVKELKRRKDCPDEVKEIPPENIAIVNRTRRMSGTSKKRGLGYFMSLLGKPSR